MGLPIYGDDRAHGHRAVANGRTHTQAVLGELVRRESACLGSGVSPSVSSMENAELDDPVLRLLKQRIVACREHLQSLG